MAVRGERPAGPEQVVVIDSDVGQSGPDADRVGFQRPVAAVGMGEVGVVLVLEVAAWRGVLLTGTALLEICGLGDTVILDEDDLYTPSHFKVTCVLLGVGRGYG